MVLIRSRCVFIIQDEDRKRGLKAETSNAWGERTSIPATLFTDALYD